MNSENESLDKNFSSKEDQLILKTEPIDVDFIKKEEIEEEKCFVVSGIVETLKDEKKSIKEEISEDDEVENCSSSNV